MNNQRRKIWIAVAAILLGWYQSAFCNEPRPNIVLIMADDIGFECFGCYGSKLYQTPNIDLLAKQGVKFTNAHAQPVCTPSRVKIMTGKYNIRNYVDFGILDIHEPTFGNMFRDAGYKTCVAGKWQLTPQDLNGPNRAGFDEYCLWNFQTGADQEHLKQEFQGRNSRYKNPDLFSNGKRLENLEDAYGPDIATDFILDFIKKNRDEPFFVYYPMILVHNPIVPTPDSKGWNGEKLKNTPENKQVMFEQMVRYMDKLVGKIINSLDAYGLRENTLIIFTGDNGTTAGIRSPIPGRGIVIGGKNSSTDNGTHVPFVLNWKNEINPGTIIDSPTDFADILPTLAEITGTKLPSTDIDGQSFWPLIQGDMSKERGWVFISYGRGGKIFNCWIQDRRWKLYANGSLYDVPNDWNEEHPATGMEADEARKKLGPILDGILSEVPPDRPVDREKGSFVTRKNILE